MKDPSQAPSRSPLQETAATPQLQRLRPRSRSSTASIPHSNNNNNKKKKRRTTVSSSTPLVSPTHHHRHDPTEVVVNLRALEDRMNLLFSDDPVTQVPCLSARIFALYSLASEHNHRGTTPPPTMSGVPKYPSWLLGPFLKSLVHAEVVALSDYGDYHSKRVHFEAHTGSAVLSPVDRIPRSGAQFYEHLEALKAVKEQVEHLKQQGRTGLIQPLIHFLDRDLGQSLQQIVAQSISSKFPIQRVVNATQVYQQQLCILIVDRHSNTPTIWEQRLAESVGQAIRCQLRSLWNDAPVKLGPKDVEYDIRAMHYSKVRKHVILTDSENGAAVEDECISAIVSNALRCIYEVLGMEQAMLSASLISLPHVFCASPATQRTLSTRNDAPPLSLNQVQEIVQDIQYATDFLAATRACRFLVDIMAIPGVHAEIERRGGWIDVQTFATLSWTHDLCQLCPDDAHLVMLSNFDVLWQRLRAHLPTLEQLAHVCDNALVEATKRLKLKTTKKSKELWDKYPDISFLAQVLAEGRDKADNIPMVEVNPNPFAAS